MAIFRSLWLSYVADWIVVILFAAAGGVLNRINGFHRPFSVQDASIAFPLKNDIISLPVVAIVSAIGPAAVIGVLSATSALLRRRRRAQASSTLFARSAAWELQVGWLGLAFALATTLFVTSGLKDMVGKPRPDLLARCHPDLANLESYIVGGFGTRLDSDAPPLVSSAICMQANKKVLDDGFAAFPSGHSSFSCAGMVYLSLWLCAKWAVAIPVLGRYSQPRAEARTNEASPPLWQVAVCMAPIGVALFICSTRYADFHHAGVDIIAGAILGTVLAWSSFRLFHLPVRRGSGLLAWGPRSPHQAFLAGNGALRKLHDEEQARDAAGYELRDTPHTIRGPSGSSHEPIIEHAGGQQF
ncbi:PAP2-domain-containing protein [Myriangium duriaei CBS 260.36]|uniref:PAP2-domain-containing protein n=1 Tax=Myriangium duriaei CBS 260.36 TaxID=1168546 RepID=A0A9P4J0M2_9PEZI|nr:PAP2-domain-containing protein [Myriangium duriaei CBS 260.36]